MDSRLYLPKLQGLQEPPLTILDYLVLRFPHIDAQSWWDRAARGLIRFEDGTVLTRDTPYSHGRTVYYAREVFDEPGVEESEIVIFRDENILVADKPRGMV